MYIVIAILLFGILIAAHEWGHFIAARLCGVTVHEFSIGMGPALWKHVGKKGTQFSIRALPIGGYCAMEGEEEESDDPRSLNNQGFWKKVFVFAAGALIEPLSCCIRGLRNAGTGFNDDVLIVGAGPIGLFHLQLSKIAGARKVIVSEPNEARRKVAKELGADLVVDPSKEDLAAIVNRETNGQGMDVIVMAIGVPALVNPTLKLCKRGGTVNLFAGFAGTGESTVEVNTIHYNEINVNGSTAYKLEDYLAAAEMIKSGKIDADKIVTHKFKIEDFQKAYDVCVAGTGLKVVIEP